jgi:integrative and conjugative element protein (TIGR02256 family)
MIKRVHMSASVRASIGAHIAAIPDRETGGILLGHATEPGTIVITKASPPGPRAVHRRFYFARDTRFLQRWLDDEYDRSDGNEDYVGEWHVHRAFDAPPSCVDRRSLWRIARKANYATDEPVLLIVEDKPPERRFRAYGFEVKPKRCEEAACL